jgi:hypothetical protein
VKDKVSLCCGDQLLCIDCEEENDRLLKLQGSAQAATEPELTADTEPCAELADGLDMTTDMSTCELLCFLQNKMKVLPFDDLVNIVADFYMSLEIENARKLLSKYITIRLPKHKGVARDKNRKIVADILKVCLDPNVLLPVFKAVDLSRLPPIGVDHIDLSALLQELTSLRAEVRAAVSIRAELTEIHSWLKDMPWSNSTGSSNTECQTSAPVSASVTSAVCDDRTVIATEATSAATEPAPPAASTAAGTTAVTPRGISFSTMASQLRDAGGIVSLVEPRKKSQRKPIIGAATTNTRVKAVSTVRSVNLFMSRVHPSTTDRDIIDSVLSGQGELDILDVKVTQLTSRHEDLYSSYHIEILVKADQLKRAIESYMSAQAWPTGVFIRRFFKPKNGGS